MSISKGEAASPVVTEAFETIGFKEKAKSTLEHSPRLYNAARGVKRSIKERVLTSSYKQGNLAEINKWHGLEALENMEGFMSPAQAKFFRNLLMEDTSIVNIAEIGFNAGHSAFNFCKSRDDIKVTSFDIGDHDYVKPTAEFLRTQFPGRLDLILGDSGVTIPSYAQANPDKNFDLAFIDGGHDRATATSDIANMQKLVKPGGLVVVDDYIKEESFGIGPYRAWNDAVHEAVIQSLGVVKDGDHRAWAIGRYALR